MTVQTKSTTRVKSINVYQILRDLEDALNAVGAHEEAEKVSEQKRLVMKNLAESADKLPAARLTPMPGTLAKSVPSIDWNGF